MKISQEQYELAKKLIPSKLSQKEIGNICNIPGGYVYLIKKAKTYEELKTLYDETYKPKPKQSTPKVSPVTGALSEVLKQQSNTEVLHAIKGLEAKVDEMLVAYKWIVEHAQVDYKKKKWF